MRDIVLFMCSKQITHTTESNPLNSLLESHALNIPGLAHVTVATSLRQELDHHKHTFSDRN
jgi:hypothetical protein